MGWQEKLKNSTYQRVARKAGVRNLDSRNDVRKIKAYLAKNPKLTQEKYIKNAKAAGIQRLDSASDISQIDDFLGPSGKPQKSPNDVIPTTGPGSEPKGPAAAPAPVQPQQPQVDYSSVFQGYQNTINQLTASYNAAITSSSQLQQQNAQAQQESADKYKELQQQNESLTQANQRFLDASANAKLSALRSGTTTGGSNSSAYGSDSAGLSGGTTQYQGPGQGSGKESSISSGTPVENSVLSRKGPVVQQLNTALSRQTSAPVRPNSGLASGRGASYYATRFG